MQRTRLRGREAFESRYRALFGQEWEALRQALSKTRPVRQSNGYSMDEASVSVAEALEVRPGQRVLDLCAAPGGKALLLAEALDGEGELVLNEISTSRRARLKRVIYDHLEENLRSVVRVTPFNASLWSRHESHAYDRVLADVPCSTEAHVYRSEADLKNWTSGRSRSLVKRQKEIALSAYSALKSGGRMVYSTCALEPEENDGVVRWLLEVTDAEHMETEEEAGSATEFGWQFLPHTSLRGPCYYAILERPFLNLKH